MTPAQPDPDNNVVHGVFQVFDRREDDFSVSLALSDDPIFWLRFEKDSMPGTIVFTDFKAGSQSDPVMARALATALSDDAGAGVQKLVFHDLVPGEHDPAHYRMELNRVSQNVRGWIDTAARMNGRSLSKTNLETERGKARLVVELT